MSFDLFQSRRNYNEPCKWWNRDMRDKYDPDELVHKRVPTGTFMAKEVSAETERNNPVANTWLLNRTGTTIKTPDDVFGIQSECLVWYQGELWLVVDVQKIKARIQQTQFATDKHCSHYWYIELRK